MSGGGIFNQSSFYGAGIPYLTGSTIAPGQQQAYFLPSVAKRVQVQITDVSGGVGAVRVAFGSSTAQGSNVINNNHFWTVFQTAALKSNLDVNAKCTVIYVIGQTGPATYQVFAELSSVSSNDFVVPLSGTGIDK